METIVKDRIFRVGKSLGGCTVYYIRPLGYWIAPKHISITRNKHQHLAIIRNVYSKENLQLSCGRTADDFIRAATQLLEHVASMGKLWLTNSRIVDQPLIIYEDGEDYSVAIPKALQNGRKRFHTSNKNLALKKSVELRDELCERYAVSLEDALTFHNLCPELRK